MTHTDIAGNKIWQRPPCSCNATDGCTRCMSPYINKQPDTFKTCEGELSREEEERFYRKVAEERRNRPQ